jgi:hypothetical protein
MRVLLPGVRARNGAAAVQQGPSDTRCECNRTLAPCGWLSSVGRVCAWLPRAARCRDIELIVILMASAQCRLAVCDPIQALGTIWLWLGCG